MRYLPGFHCRLAAVCVCVCAPRVVGRVGPVTRQQWVASVAWVSPLLCTDQDPCRGLGCEAGAGSPRAEGKADATGLRSWR